MEGIREDTYVHLRPGGERPSGSLAPKRPRSAALSDLDVDDGEGRVPQTTYCCFPTCPRSSRRGGRPWLSAAQVVQHVNTTHVSNGEVPSQGWLDTARRWMCGHCCRLVPTGRPCGSDDCFRVKGGIVPSQWVPGQGSRLPVPGSHVARPSSSHGPPIFAVPSLSAASPGTPLAVPCPWAPFFRIFLFRTDVAVSRASRMPPRVEHTVRGHSRGALSF